MISNKIFYLVPIDSPNEDIVWHMAKIMRRFSSVIHILPNLEIKTLFEGRLVDPSDDLVVDILFSAISAKRPITLARNSFAIGLIDKSKFEKISTKNYLGCAWSPASTAIVVDCYGHKQVLITLMHELGHLVGLRGHCKNGKCIMSQGAYRSSFCTDCQSRFDKGLEEDRERLLSLTPVVDFLSVKFLKLLLPKA